MVINDKLAEISQVAYSTLATLRHTYDMTMAVQGIDGSLVECGVAGGAQLMAMALTYTNKDIIGFDSFQGIPKAGQHDDQQPGIGDKSQPYAAMAVHSPEQVLENFQRYNVHAYRVRLIRGWFENSLQKFQPVPIALLRLDGDLYESTLTCLKYLYPLVSLGGVVIIDDYGLPGCAKAVHDYFGENMPELLEVEGSWGVKYFYKTA